jgi:carboxyl-terminal processing protease
MRVELCERAYVQERKACLAGNILSILVILTLMLPAVFGQGQGNAGQQVLQQVEPELERLWDQKRFDKAVTLLEDLKNRPEVTGDPESYQKVVFGLARAQAQLGNRGKAIEYLGFLRDNAEWLTAEDLKSDSSFESLRAESDFAGILAAIELRDNSLRRFWDSPSLKTPYRENLSEDEKIAGLSRLWSEAKYNFVFFRRIPELDWDAQFVHFLPLVRQTVNTAEYYRVLQQMCALLRDGHTMVRPPKELVSTLNAKPALTSRLVEDKVLVVEVQGNDVEQQGIRPGYEIIAIDGTAVAGYARQYVIPFQSASTQQDLDVNTYQYALLRGPEDKPVRVTVRAPEGETRTVALRRTSNPAPSSPPLEWKMLGDGIAYVTLNTFLDDNVVPLFESSLPELQKSKALVIDIRNNTGGKSPLALHILSCLSDKPFLTSGWRSRKYIPAYRAWGQREGWYEQWPSEIKPGSDMTYTKPVVLLTSARTYSSAEEFAAAFSVMRRGKIVGELTGGSTGNPLRIILPGGGSALICTKHNRFPDGGEFVGVGVKPEIPVKVTIADVRAGRDPVLEAALEYLHTVVP